MEHDRRTFLKRAGTVAWATPLIVTLGASRAAAQASCLPSGSGCGIYFEDMNGPGCAASSVGNLLCCTACVPVSGACVCA